MVTKRATWALVLLLLTVFFSTAKEKEESTKLTLKQVFSFQDFSWAQKDQQIVGRIDPIVRFSPNGREIYLVEPFIGEVSVLDWRKKRTIRRMNYKNYIQQ